jgi:hypothetical protein
LGDDPYVDEHGRRVTQAFRDTWRELQQGRATLLDLSRTAEQAAGALDHSDAELLRLLNSAWGDLEYVYHANEREDHAAEARRILEPILALMDSE